MKKVVLMFIALGATFALTTPAMAQAPGGPPPGGMRGPGGPGGPGGRGGRMAQMVKAREAIYAKLGLSPVQKKALDKLDKKIAEKRQAMFGGAPGGGMRGPGGPGGPPPGGPGGGGMRGPGGPGGPGGFGGMKEKFQAIQKEQEEGMKKILTKHQFEKFTTEWEKVRASMRGPGGGGGMRGPGGPGGGPRGG